MATTPRDATEGRAADYRYSRARRKNYPPAGLAAEGRIAERQPALRYDPTSRWDFRVCHDPQRLGAELATWPATPLARED